jgi:hypothetical protein
VNGTHTHLVGIKPLQGLAVEGVRGKKIGSNKPRITQLIADEPDLSSLILKGHEGRRVVFIGLKSVRR